MLLLILKIALVYLIAAYCRIPTLNVSLCRRPIGFFISKYLLRIENFSCFLIGVTPVAYVSLLIVFSLPSFLYVILVCQVPT